jgi:hypothetical protein
MVILKFTLFYRLALHLPPHQSFLFIVVVVVVDPTVVVNETTTRQDKI